MIIQLNPTMPLITPKGTAIAHFLIDDGIENDLKWVCFQDETGECWTWNNRHIRVQKNITEGRENISSIDPPPKSYLDDAWIKVKDRNPEEDGEYATFYEGVSKLTYQKGRWGFYYKNQWIDQVIDCWLPGKLWEKK